MRRYTQLAACIALLGALCCRALAGVVPAARLDPARVFDPASESLLAVIAVPPAQLSPIVRVLFGSPSAPPVLAQVAPTATPAQADVVDAVHLRDYVAQMPAMPSLQLQAPQVHPSVPQPHVAAVSQLDAGAPAVHFGSYTFYAPAQQSLHERIDVPVRVGAVRFSGSVSGAQAQTVHVDAVREMQLCGTTDEAAACPYLHDERVQDLAAATNFDVRAGNTRVNLRLSGSVSKVVNRDAAMYQYAPLDPDLRFDSPGAGSLAQSPADSSLLYYPGLADVVRHGLNASLAVPISPALTIGVQYDRTHYEGNYGTILTPGFDARKDTYLGNVTYTLPNSSSLTLSARQYRFQDSLAPNFNLTQTRADLQFTVKF